MTRSFRTGLAAFALVAAPALAPAAHAQVGGASVLFLQIEPDSRAAGMGNASAALADNANATFWNPAGLGFQRGTEFGLTHSKWLPELNADLYYEYGVAKHHLGKYGTLGLHVTYLDLGEFTPTDDNGNELGDPITSRDVAVGLAYGKEITPNLALGATARYIYSDLASGTTVSGGSDPLKPGKTFAVDLGALYRSNPIDLGGVSTTLRAGLNLANFGGPINYTGQDGSDNPIPSNVRLGLGATLDLDEFNQVNAVVDFNKQILSTEFDSTTGTRTVNSPFGALFGDGWRTLSVDIDGNGPEPARDVSALQQVTVGGGLEYWYNRLFAMRAGGFYENPYNGGRKFLTVGAGLRYNIVGADFSYIYTLGENTSLANQLRFSLLISLNR